MTAPTETPPTPPPVDSGGFELSKAGRFFAGYAWLILKNLLGWAMILVSPAIGFTLPGPGGIPIFLIGFALVTFPGKRKLTARVLRGKKLDLSLTRYDIIEIVAAVVLSTVLFWPFEKRYWEQLNLRSLTTAFHITMGLVVLSLMWVLVRFVLRGINVLIGWMPVLRRKVKPWLRGKGILLLPPRYRRRRLTKGQKVIAAIADEINDEILQIHERHRHAAARLWRNLLPWLRRAFSVGITVWILAAMIRPLHDRWPQVKDRVQDINWGQFAIASLMFAIFLFLFRAVSWRRIMKGFGFKLPLWPAVRIWSTSEMARYLPGSIWQVFGRVRLIKPYGVNSVISSTAQILELCMFLFANVLVAGSCLLWYLAKISDRRTRAALIVAICLMPTLAIVLHPKIFYGAANWILARIGRPPIQKRLRGWKLVKLLGYIILGLGWQSAAVFLIAQPILHLKIDWWWMVAAAYCLGWIAGFLAFWAPGGMGVREYIFAIVMQVVTPPQIKAQYFPDPATFTATVIFLGFLLRLWTIAGELILWTFSMALDHRGTLNRPDAPGRVVAAG